MSGNASAALPPPINYANRAAHAPAAAAAAAAASSAQPPPLAAFLSHSAMAEISSKFNRDSVIRIGSLMLTFNDAQKGYWLNIVRGVEKDGVRFRDISGSGQRAVGSSEQWAGAAASIHRGRWGRLACSRLSLPRPSDGRWRS